MCDTPEATVNYERPPSPRMEKGEIEELIMEIKTEIAKYVPALLKLHHQNLTSATVDERLR